MNSFRPAKGWGPEGKRAAFCITFDNFGEAFLVDLGQWGDKPIGQHSIREFLPTLIDAVGDLRCTFFIEGINAELYPESIQLWQRSGHEVALHGWQHEFWAGRDAAERRESLARSMAVMKQIGVTPVGFRPPGGDVPPGGWDEFEAAGLLYCSDAGEDGDIRRVGDMHSLPFSWTGIDAFYFEEIAARRRKALGFREENYSTGEWAGVLDGILARIVEGGTQATIIFHPHLLESDPAKLEVLRDLVRKVSNHPDIWATRACDLARFVAEETLEQNGSIETSPSAC